MEPYRLGEIQETDLDKVSAIDDMADQPDGRDFLVPSPFLEEKLANYLITLVPLYNHANSDAMHFQNAHKNCMKIFILASTIAVIMALFQLYEPVSQKYWIFFITAEVIALVTVTVTVLLDLKFRHYHMNWVIERHRAERCRYLKFFDLLMDDMEYFRMELERIREISDYSHLETWIRERGQTQDIARSFLHGDRSSHLEEILSYYLCRRVLIQMNYFLKRHLENRERKELWTKKIPILFISIGIFLAFLHVAWEILERITQVDYLGIPFIGAFLLFMVIGLPIGVWMLNSFSLVFTYRAHAERYGGIYMALKDCLKRELLSESVMVKKSPPVTDTIKAERTEGSILLKKDDERSYLSDLIREQCGSSGLSSRSLKLSAKEIFFGMLCIEDLLESEHEEWIRITKEAISL